MGRGRVTGSEKRGGGVREAAQREFFIHCLGNNFVQMRVGKLPQKCSDNSRYTLKHFHLHKHAVWHLTNLFHDSYWERWVGRAEAANLKGKLTDSGASRLLWSWRSHNLTLTCEPNHPPRGANLALFCRSIILLFIKQSSRLPLCHFRMSVLVLYRGSHNWDSTNH